MIYYIRTISSKDDYRQGRWTCDAYSIGIDTSNDDNLCEARMNYINLVSNKMALQPFVILYNVAPYGFNRVEKYKGLNPKKQAFSIDSCTDFFTLDNGCEYMFTCAKIIQNVTPYNILDAPNKVIFLGSERNYHDLIASIPDLKNVSNIENFLITSGMIVVEDYDTIDIGSTLWFISNRETIVALSEVLCFD